MLYTNILNPIRRTGLPEDVVRVTVFKNTTELID
jgi:hypothetical protein